VKVYAIPIRQLARDDRLWLKLGAAQSVIITLLKIVYLEFTCACKVSFCHVKFFVYLAVLLNKNAHQGLMTE